MIPTSERILIVGGGPAGATAAYFLALAGFSITVAERSTNKFTYGQGIDITGAAVQVTQKMNVYNEIISKTTKEAGFSILNDAAETIASFGTASDTTGKGLSLTQEIEILRGDLTHILASKAQESDRVTYRYGCTITSIHQAANGTTATLSDTGKPEDFSLIIGADGINSPTRHLAFPKNLTHESYKGLDQYTAFFSLPAAPEDTPNARLQHAANGLAVLIRPTSLSKPTAPSSCYMISTGASAAFETALTQTPSAQKALFASHFATFPNPTAKRVLESMHAAPDFYCAQSAQIKLPTWSQNRVALVGDAAYCPSPASGQGTVLALLGSYILAGEIAARPGDVRAAFARYEERFRGYVEAAQRIPLNGAVVRLANPQSWVGVWVLRTVVRVIAWTGVWRLFSLKQGQDGFVLPEYDFEACRERVLGCGGGER
ncbi:hypothetical protein Q7P37_002918 [Cladosporium fusiforme]